MRTLLTPRWLGRHVLAVLAVLAFLALGRWQWGRGLQQSGTLQNLGYAAEWWLLAGLVVYGWGRLALDAVRPGRTRRRWRRAKPAEPVTPTSTDGTWDTAAEPAAPAVADPELDAYNDYLARLNARPRS